MKSPFATVERTLEAVAAGRIVIVVDSVERENEGDLFAAAETATPATIHFMISYGRGQLCLSVAPLIARRLELSPMVPDRPDPGAPRFAIPVDHVSCKTGISPWERAHTIRCVLDPSSRPDDFLRPGHIFPLLAEEEGVLKRPGHTEAAVDLPRLAGLTPAGVLCEVCSRDGLHMAGVDELIELGRAHDLPLIAIDDLIAYRAGSAGTVSDLGSNQEAPRRAMGYFVSDQQRECDRIAIG